MLRDTVTTVWLWAGYICIDQRSTKKTFISRKYYVGLGPKAIREDDFRVVLFGYPVPFLLRKFEDNYKLVGQCYAHVIIDSEAEAIKT